MEIFHPQAFFIPKLSAESRARHSESGWIPFEKSMNYVFSKNNKPTRAFYYRERRRFGSMSLVLTDENPAVWERFVFIFFSLSTPNQPVVVNYFSNPIPPKNSSDFLSDCSSIQILIDSSLTLVGVVRWLEVLQKPAPVTLINIVKRS